METTHLITVEALEREGTPDGRWELINGELVEMSPAGGDHGAYGIAIGSYLFAFATSRRRGRVYGADTGFVIPGNSPMVRSPDAAFVRADRLSSVPSSRGFVRVAPDLAVEIISQFDRKSEVVEKVEMWLAAGATLVWLVDPDAETVTVFERNRAPRVVTRQEILDGGTVLPDFELRVHDIFAV